jgi:glyoxylase-like metal-dependent hydrolase (beta-lactamase superfamily II)
MANKYFNRGAAVLVGMITTLGTAPGIAQTDGANSIESQRKGMEVVEAGLAALGGRQAIEDAGTVALRARVDVYSMGQGANPSAPAAAGDDGGVNLRYVFDMANDRHIYEQLVSDTATQPGARLVAMPDEIFVYNPAQNIMQEVRDLTPLRPLLRGIPYAPAILLEAVDRAASVRRLGDRTIDAKRYRVITYADESGQQIALVFNAETDLLDRSEIVESHEQLGDHVVEIEYDDYKRVGKLHLPHTASVFTAGVRATVTHFETVDLAAQLDETLLERPDDANQMPPLTGPMPNPDMEVTELGNGLYAIMNVTSGYNMMFADHGDHVFVIEAPVSTDITYAVLGKITETLPGKPVRYALITHYHYDHSGGLWGYMTEGTTVVTTPGNREFVYDIAAAPRTLKCEQPLATKPDVELVRGKRTFGTGEQRVELYEVGPNPHVDELLIAYVPSLKLMYVPDVYNYSGQVTPANEQTLSLADKLEELGLELERIIPTHGQEATGEMFWESVALGREGS